ncbi:MAG: PilZ domain-containing protein [Pseudomonadota bacterium]
MSKLFSRRARQPAPKLDLGRVRASTVKIPPGRPGPKPVKVDRRFDRKDAWAVCFVELGNGPVRDGIMLDFSDGGARVRFRSRSLLPKYVRLRSARHRLNTMAQVIWQDTFDAGLMFVSEEDVER